MPAAAVAADAAARSAAAAEPEAGCSSAQSRRVVEVAAGMHHTVVVKDSAGIAVRVQGKPKILLVDACSDVAVELEGAICGLEVVNCARLTLSVARRVPTISVDKTADVQLTLASEDALDTQVVWCDASGITLRYLPLPVAAGEDAPAAPADGEPAGNWLVAPLLRPEGVDPRKQLITVVSSGEGPAPAPIAAAVAPAGAAAPASGGAMGGAGAAPLDVDDDATAAASEGAAPDAAAAGDSSPPPSADERAPAATPRSVVGVQEHGGRHRAAVTCPFELFADEQYLGKMRDSGWF